MAKNYSVKNIKTTFAMAVSKEISANDLRKTLLKDVSITPLWSKIKHSFAWKYFGMITVLCNDKSIPYKDNKVFCTECLTNAKMKNPNDLLIE